MNQEDLILTHSRLVNEAISKAVTDGTTPDLAFTAIFGATLEAAGECVGFTMLEPSSSKDPVAIAINDQDPAFPLTVYFADFVLGEELKTFSIEAEEGLMEEILGDFSEGKAEDLLQLPRISPEVRSLAAHISKDLKKLRIVILTNRSRHRKNQSLMAKAGPIDFRIYDVSAFAELTSSENPIVRDLLVPLPTTGNLKVQAVGPFGSDTGKYETYLAVIPANILVEMYSNYGQELMEKNVRSFLQVKNKVNSSMLKTVDTEPEMFLAYNNGLAMTVSKLETLEDPSSGKIITYFQNPQIVNGGQTTAVLYHASKVSGYPISQVMVQAKITVVPDLKSAEQLIPQISEYANNQSAVKRTAFASRDKFHLTLAELSKSMTFSDAELGSSSWYYEVREGEYEQSLNLSPSAAAAEEFLARYPRGRRITKLELAIYFNTWEQRPWQVAKGDGINFADFQERRVKAGVESKADNWRTFVAQAVLFRGADKIVANLNLGGYKRMTIAYTLSLISNIRQKRIDWAGIATSQEIPLALEEQIKLYAPKVRQLIIEAAGDRNVLSYAKSESCWLKLKEDFKNQVPEHKAEPTPVPDEILDPKFLRRCHLWMVETDFSTPRNRQIVQGCAARLSRGTALSERQEAAVLSLVQNAINEGFI